MMKQKKTDSWKGCLKDLGKTARERAQKPVTPIPPLELTFAELMADVVPLPPSGKKPRDAAPKVIRRRQHEFSGSLDVGMRYIAIAEDVPPAQWCKNGRGQKDIDLLRKGFYPIAHRLDLHGMNANEAQEALSRLVATRRGVCAEIIHGSGLGSREFKPVLKHVTRHWLASHPDVLAYCEPHQGNDGAVWVLFKRINPK